VGAGILGFFTMREANVLRLVCSEMREAVAGAAWLDGKTKIEGSLAAWRACFPKARTANVLGHLDLEDSDFVHLKGIHTLNMAYCDQAGITDAAFVHLKGIHTLSMSGCNQVGITDAAFVNLKGIHTLIFDDCNQAAIAKDLAHLLGIQTRIFSCKNVLAPPSTVPCTKTEGNRKYNTKSKVKNVKRERELC
jgi:hypothetical protein